MVLSMLGSKETKLCIDLPIFFFDQKEEKHESVTGLKTDIGVLLFPNVVVRTCELVVPTRGWETSLT